MSKHRSSSIGPGKVQRQVAPSCESQLAGCHGSGPHAHPAPFFGLSRSSKPRRRADANGDSIGLILLLKFLLLNVSPLGSNDWNPVEPKRAVLPGRPQACLRSSCFCRWDPHATVGRVPQLLRVSECGRCGRLVIRHLPTLKSDVNIERDLPPVAAGRNVGRRGPTAVQRKGARVPGWRLPGQRTNQSCAGR